MNQGFPAYRDFRFRCSPRAVLAAQTPVLPKAGHPADSQDPPYALIAGGLVLLVLGGLVSLELRLRRQTAR